MSKTYDIRVAQVAPLLSPEQLRREFPMTPQAEKAVTEGRTAIENILTRKDHRLLIVVGPCSIHDPKGAMEYARRLHVLHRELGDIFFIVMRTYFEKPRTSIGWKGLINDPHMNDSCDIESGLRIGYKLLMEVAELGLPAATEFVDSIVPQYLADLVCWASIGARTTESQSHRELASGLSMPVGFKNGTDGSLQGAIDALRTALRPHSFLGIDQEGCTGVVRSKGNPFGHIVLRGGRARTNYDAISIKEAAQQLEKSGLPTGLMVDCSHANSGKQPARQELVWKNLMEQLTAKDGCPPLIGAMLESNLHEGNQPMQSDPAQLNYGVSVTDACISWETTETLLREGAAMLRKSKASLAA
jgi:3-deoxy-7-phosphoheptulonate synthase